jgi:glycosyltransferase involved in cell wall biosynthesis
MCREKENLIYQPKASIIMNCYNGDKFLRESLNSIINQTYRNWELIFWDNLSNDESKRILNEYNDDRIKYFSSKNFLSLYEARNQAISKCSGKYVFFLDVDDIWFENKIEEQILYFQNNPNYKIVYSNYKIKDEIKKKVYLRYKNFLPEGSITHKLLKNYTIGILSVCLERSVFEKFKFDSTFNIVGDFDFFIKVSLYEKIGCIQMPLAYYRIHENNYSLNQVKLHIDELKRWCENNKILNSKKGCSLIYQKFYILKLMIKYLIKKIKSK